MERLQDRWEKWVRQGVAWLWDAPSRGAWSPVTWGRYGLRLGWLTLERYYAHRLATHASGLAFFLLLSLVPLLAFLFMILKVFQVTDMVRPYLLRIVTGGNLQLVDYISTYIENTQVGRLGVLGVLTLFAVGFIVLRRVKTTLNVVWQVERRPGYRYQIVEYIAILVIAPFLLVATFSLTTFLQGLAQMDAMAMPQLFGLSGMALTRLSGHLLMWLLVFYAYAFLPDTRVGFSAALVGSLVAGSLLRMVEGIYLVTLFKVANYDMVYGALAVLPFMMIWFYMAWTVFLLGSQLSFVLQNFSMVVERYRASGQFISTTPFAIVTVLAALLRCMEETGGAASPRKIRARTGLPRGVVADAVDRLTAARLVTPVMDHPGQYVPQEVLEHKTVREVLDRVNMLPKFSEPPAGWGHSVSGGLMELFREASEGMAGRLELMTIGSLAEKSKG